jgi:hypothetical protein
MAIIKKADVKENDGKYTIDIDGKDNSILILAWFEHDASKFQLANVWNKLQNNQKTTPLLHRAWRQPETEFESPQYINILPSNRIFDRIIGEDMAITGQVALSKGRYLHFTNQLNLFRSLNTTYADEGEIDESPDLVFSLTEREQVKSGELHYFDNPWFGTLVKITEYKGEETNE